MPSRDETMLRTILEVRGLQRRAAEAAVARANALVRQREAHQEEGRRRLDADQAAWAACMSAQRLPLTQALAWAAAVNGSEDALVTARRDLEEARAGSAEAGHGWKRAQARQEAVEGLLRDATRANRKRRDEMLLAEFEDRAGRKG